MSPGLPDLSPAGPGGWGRQNESSLLTDDGRTERWRVAVTVASVGIAVAFWLVGGVAGLLGTAVTVLAWYGFGTPFAIGAAVVVVAPMAAESLPSVTLVGFVVVSLLLVPATAAQQTGRYVLVTAVLLALFGSVPVLLGTSGSLWLVAAGLLGGLGLGSYGLHRYQLLVLGRLDGGTSSDSKHHERKGAPVDPDTGRY